jgi:hypothetical protein
VVLDNTPYHTVTIKKFRVPTQSNNTWGTVQKEGTQLKTTLYEVIKQFKPRNVRYCVDEIL